PPGSSPSVHLEIRPGHEHITRPVRNNRPVAEDARRKQANGAGDGARRARTGRGAPRPSRRRVSPAGTPANAVAAPAAPSGGAARTSNAPSEAAVPVSPPARTRAPVSELPEDRYFNRELSWLDFNARVLAL